MTASISPSDLECLQRIFDRVCTWCHIERPSERADLLASFPMDQFRAGISETELFEAAMAHEDVCPRGQPSHEHHIARSRLIN
ncbi:hypothetical protein B9J07_35595 [Sinorhizobium sp. LM21]|nr:hypothetical protein B9J07_35595 [Sinorhizobium sp. LM21]